MSWAALLLLAGGAYLFKLVGVLAGDRFGDGTLRNAIQLIPAALFCALIALQTFERDTDLVVDARVVGVAVAVVATVKRVPFVGVIVLATIATAVSRLVAS